MVFLVSTLHKKLNNVPCNPTQNDGALEKSTSLPPASFSTWLYFDPRTEEQEKRQCSENTTALDHGRYVLWWWMLLTWVCRGPSHDLQIHVYLVIRTFLATQTGCWNTAGEERKICGVKWHPHLHPHPLVSLDHCFVTPTRKRQWDRTGWQLGEIRHMMAHRGAKNPHWTDPEPALLAGVHHFRALGLFIEPLRGKHVSGRWSVACVFSAGIRPLGCSKIAKL